MGIRLAWLVFIFLTPTAHTAAQTFAAQSPHHAGTGPVVWSSDESIAMERAVQACERIGQGCSKKAAVTDVTMSQMFVTTCCFQQDGSRCHITPTPFDEDRGREEAFATSVRTFAEAGFATDQCWREAVYSVRTGKRLRN